MFAPTNLHVCVHLRLAKGSKSCICQAELLLQKTSPELPQLPYVQMIKYYNRTFSRIKNWGWTFRMWSLNFLKLVYVTLHPSVPHVREKSDLLAWTRPMWGKSSCTDGAQKSHFGHCIAAARLPSQPSYNNGYLRITQRISVHTRALT